MRHAARPLGPESRYGLLVALAALCAPACSGTDRLTAPLVSVGGTYIDSLGITSSAADGGGSANGAGGASANGGASAAGGSATTTATTTFDWGTANYDANGGSSVDHQTNHYPGMACFMTCHAHTITFGGTAYQSDGTNAAGNAQIGIRANGTLTTTYAGSVGNFFATLSGSVDWGTAQIAIRTANGTRAMPVNASANGNCNNCHDAGNRIVVP